MRNPVKEAIPLAVSLGSLRSSHLVLTVVAVFVLGAVVLGHSVLPSHVEDPGMVEYVQDPPENEVAQSKQGETLLSPPWDAFSWSYALYGLAGVGVVIALVRWRTAYVDRQRERLEREIVERTGEVQRQKQQLETYNRELLRTNEQLRNAIEEKSRLLGVAAHDLKNPLFGIRALSEILLEGDDLQERTERKLTLIHESADETLRLIDGLLTSAASSAKSQVDFEPVDVAALTKWVVHSFEPHAERKGQDLACTVGYDDCVVEGDKRKLREAISNLVSNALKYSPTGASVEVTVDCDGDLVHVDVSDAGPGLSGADQQRLFAPFQRLTPEPTGDESSSGLGLYIVKQIVDLHNGAVDVESEVGEGSTFTIRLPAVSADVDPVPEVDPPEEPMYT